MVPNVQSCMQSPSPLFGPSSHSSLAATTPSPQREAHFESGLAKFRGVMRKFDSHC
jgi:hypothetical protein